MLRFCERSYRFAKRHLAADHLAGLLWWCLSGDGQLTSRMDDVEDNSELRRGIPVAHQVYGVPQTINTANYVYFLAVQELIGLARHCAQKQRGKGKGKGKAEVEAEEEIDLVAVVNGGSLLKLLPYRLRSLCGIDVKHVQACAVIRPNDAGCRAGRSSQLTIR